MKEFRKTEVGLFICEECKKPFKNCQQLSKHIKISHNGAKEYYDKWLKEYGEGKCKYCRKDTIFISFKKHGYRTYCSAYCMGKYNSKLTENSLVKRRKTNKEKYGVECILQSKEIKERGMIKKYNVTNAYQIPKYRKKANDAIFKKYGVVNPTQNNEIFLKL